MKLYKSTSIFFAATIIIISLSYNLKAQGVWNRKPSNLKVLPDTVDTQKLRGMMMNFTQALGVRCEYCHDDSKGGGFNEMDFPSDAKKTKQIARVMMKMVQTINTGFLQQANQIDKLEATVSCVTCHHGSAKVQSLSDVLLKTYNESGIDSTFSVYNKLKQMYYGGFTYDFRENSLTEVGFKMMESKNYDDAIKILEFNNSMYPDSWRNLEGLGEAYMGKNDNETAKEYFKKSLAINPRNRRIQQILNRLQ